MTAGGQGHKNFVIGDPEHGPLTQLNWSKNCRLQFLMVHLYKATTNIHKWSEINGCLRLLDQFKRLLNQVALCWYPGVMLVAASTVLLLTTAQHSFH